VVRAKKKSEIGAKFLQLQICYVVDRMDAFVRGCVGEGITDRTALLPTICLTKSAKALEFMNAKVPGIHVPDDVIRQVKGASHQAEASFQLSLDLARTYLEMPGVAGLHLADFRHDDAVARLTHELGLNPRETSDSTASHHYEEKHAHGSQLAG
jgi:methylenetetrahydrofolate reductase (NADPH)